MSIVIKNMEPKIEIAIFAAIASVVLISIIAITIAICRRKPKTDDIENEFPRNSNQQQLPGIPNMVVAGRINEIKKSVSCYVHYDSPKPEPRYCFKNPAFEIDEFVTHLEDI